MKKVLLIGNGFDIAHGLPTQYKEFIEFVRKFNMMYEINEGDSNFLIRNEKYMKVLITLFQANDRKSSDFIKQFRKYTVDNIWIRHFWNVMHDRGENWIDFEKEISTVVRKIERLYREQPDVNGVLESLDGFEEFKIDLEQRISELGSSGIREIKYEEKGIDYYMEKLDELIRAFELYLTFYVADIYIDKPNPDILSLELGEEDSIISFNYTDTYNRVYVNNKVEDVHFIHGKADINNTIDTNNMVIGIDEYLTEEEEKADKNLKYLGFRKYFQRIVKGTDASYKNIFKNVRNDDTIELYIFGHSLDVTDRDILKEIILNPNVKVTIFSKDKTAQKGQVNNLVKVLSSKDVIENTYSNEPKIKFKIQTAEG